MHVLFLCGEYIMAKKEQTNENIYSGVIKMETGNREKAQYSYMADILTPNSSVFKNTIKAFVTGGLICIVGQLLKKGFSSMNFSEDEVSLLTNMVLIGTSVTLTGFGIYSKLGRFCGAGTIVPITGFANSMASSAIEGKSEGWIMGLGASIFAVAGPVIVYGLLTSTVVGIIYYFVK